MAREINLTSKEWCNIIFEGKNKEYGAYMLRKESSKRHYVAFTIVSTIAVFLFSIPAINNVLGINKPSDIIISDEINVTKFDPPQNEPIKPQIEEPVREKVAPAIKFIAPVIKPDDEVNEKNDFPPMDVITDFKGVISTINHEGESPDGVDPATILNNTTIIDDTENDNKLHNNGTIEVNPSFPGGDSELMIFLRSNIKYPILAQEYGIQGIVTVQFVVGRDGSIEDVQIAKSVDKSLDAEALRVVKSMPRWIPGKQGGRAVRVKYYVPVKFKLSQ